MRRFRSRFFIETRPRMAAVVGDLLFLGLAHWDLYRQVLVFGFPERRS